MFATRRFSDEVQILDDGLGSIAASASSASSSGGLIDLSKFQKVMFTLYTNGGFGGSPSVYVYSCSTSASSISSASSNWSIVDSTNLVLTCPSTAGSVSSNRYAGRLEVRAEKLMNQCSTSSAKPIQYIRPVVTMGSAASSGSSSFNGHLYVEAVLPAYGPASTQGTSLVTTEVDYL